MSKRTTRSDLGALFDLMVERMTEVVREGETEVVKAADGSTQVVRVPPKAATLNVVRQFLAQQGINADPDKHAGLKGLVEATKHPFQPDDGDEPQVYQ